MKDLRFKLVVLASVPLLLYSVPKGKRMLKNRDQYTNSERHKHALHIVNYVKNRCNVDMRVYGKENIPEGDGIVFYSNHQGKFDALGVLLSVDKEVGMLWAKKTADMPLCEIVAPLTDSVIIDLDHKRDSVRAILELTEKIKAGGNYLIFPEGRYIDNGNHLIDFQTGCFAPAIKTGATIVPVAVYDSYRALNINTLTKERPEVHYLKPITAEEYKGLSKQELCELVRSRIEEKLAERRKAHGE